MAHKDIGIWIQKTNRENLLWELYFSNELFFGIPDFGISVNTASNKKIEFGERFDMVYLLIVIK